MHTLRLLCLLACLCTAGAHITHAQGAYGIVSYDLGIPLGNTSDYINKISFRGAGVEFGGFITDKISLGVGASYNVFYKSLGRVTFNTENNTTVTGKQYRYFNTVPIYGMARYYFKSARDETLHPYVSVGAGTIYANVQTDVGLFSSLQEGWQLGLFPEVGVGYRIASNLSATVSGRYHQGFANDDLPATSYIGINLGIRFVLR